MTRQLSRPVCWTKAQVNCGQTRSNSYDELNWVTSCEATYARLRCLTNQSLGFICEGPVYQVSSRELVDKWMVHHFCFCYRKSVRIFCLKCLWKKNIFWSLICEGFNKKHFLLCWHDHDNLDSFWIFPFLLLFRLTSKKDTCHYVNQCKVVLW